MKHLLFYFMLSFSFLNSISAQKCASIDKKDPFTNQRIIETEELRIYGTSLLQSDSWAYHIFFSNKGGQLYLGFNAVGAEVSSSFDSVLFKLSNGTLITFKNFESEGEMSSGTYHSEKSYCKTDKTAINNFLNSKVTYIRLFANETKVDIEVKSAKSDKINDLVKCILSYTS